MGKWNYRIMAHEYKNEIFFQIHEVYYDENEIPNSCTKEPISVGGDDLNGINWQLKQMKSSIKKPILWYGDKFPSIYK